MIGSASIGEDITERHRVDQAMQSLAAQLRALSRRLVDVRESERRQLARELHDRVGQNLTALGLDLGILRAKLDAHGDPEIRLRLEESARLLDDTADAIENVLSDLRPPMLDDYGLLTALQWYANNFFKRTGIPVEVRGDELGTRPPANIEIALFRVAQEALTNIAKHAGATRVIIELERSPEEVVMSIIDNGVGFDASSAGNAMAKRGLGMVTMRERCEAVGGRFEVISAPNAGTTIIARIPC